MPDVWATVSDLDSATQGRLADVLEARGAEPQQQAMRRAFLSDLPFAVGAHVLDVGCGTGVSTRLLANWSGIASVIGVDLAQSLLDKAAENSAHLPNVRYERSDGRSLPFEDRAFDAVVFDSTLSHVPAPDRALNEAFRVLRAGGLLVVFDGDYATTTVALADYDPLQACVDAMMANSVTDRRLMRRLPSLVAAAGFTLSAVKSFGFVETSREGYMLTVVDRGADTLAGLGHIGQDTAAALKAEARRRLAAGTFFGHIGYVGLLARKE